MENESDLAYAGERRAERGSYDVLLDPVHGAAMPQGYTVYFIPERPDEDPEPEVAVVPEATEAIPEAAEVESVLTPEPVQTSLPAPSLEPARAREPEVPAWMLTTGWTPQPPPVDSAPKPATVTPPTPERPSPASPPIASAPTVSEPPAADAPAAERVTVEQPVAQPFVPTPVPAPGPAPPVDRPRRSQHRKPEPVAAQTHSPQPSEVPTVGTVPVTVDPLPKHAQPPVPAVRRRITTVRLAALGTLVVVIGGLYLVSQQSDDQEAAPRGSGSLEASVTSTVPTVPVPLSNPDITGSIVYNDGSTLVIVQAGRNEMTVETNASTRVVGTDETVPELVVGQEVLVQGTRTLAGTYLAQTITMQP
ncbi:hypothetical protein ACNHUS_07430 [Actinomycetes bacterium M1A6_2h]